MRFIRGMVIASFKLNIWNQKLFWKIAPSLSLSHTHRKRKTVKYASFLCHVYVVCTWCVRGVYVICT